MNFFRLNVDNKVGCLTCFAQSSENSVLGLSAFHVLTGVNSLIDNDVVKTKNEKTYKWIKFGVAYDGRCWNGTGQHGDYGKLDYAIFKLYPFFLIKIKDNLKSISLSPLLDLSNPNNIEGQEVYGFSSTNKCFIRGKVSSVYHQVNQEIKFDTAIEVLDGMFVNEGDSGMLWRDKNGCALFMHTHSNKNNYGELSYGSFISRIPYTAKFLLFEYQE